VEKSTAVTTTSEHVVENAAAITKTSEEASKIMGVANAVENTLTKPSTTETTIAVKEI
jgi:hypothetical protein